MDEWALDEKSNCNESAIFFVIVQMLLITFITRKSICENETFLNINLRHYFCSPFSFRCHSSYSIRLALINTIALDFANGTRGTCRCIIIPNSANAINLLFLLDKSNNDNNTFRMNRMKFYSDIYFWFHCEFISKNG